MKKDLIRILKNENLKYTGFSGSAYEFEGTFSPGDSHVTCLLSFPPNKIEIDYVDIFLKIQTSHILGEGVEMIFVPHWYENKVGSDGKVYKKLKYIWLKDDFKIEKEEMEYVKNNFKK